MPQRALPRDTIIERLRALQAHGWPNVSMSEACRRARIPRTRGEHLAHACVVQSPPIDPRDPATWTAAPPNADPDKAVDVGALHAKIRDLNKQLAGYDKRYADQNWIKETLFGLKEQPVVLPDWLTQPKKHAKAPGIPEMVWSDWHWGEVVKREQLNGVNEYNLEIAHQRSRTLVERTILLLREYMVHPTYEGVVVNLGGDMLSGIIHEELVATNAKAIMACVVDLWGVLEWCLRQMAEEFGKVAVFCVVGNHGRSTRKWVSKDAAETSFDWLIYCHLAAAFAKDKRIRIIVPYATDQLYAVYGHRRLLTHGNQFRGGDGIIGSIGPVTRGRQKKHSRNAEIGQSFATMIHGHFHTYSPGDRIIGNGSLIGYNQFASDNNFGVEDPKQAMWITHPQHGITFHVPVFCEAVPRHAKAEKAIAWMEVK